jgi:hypothetical protein
MNTSEPAASPTAVQRPRKRLLLPLIFLALLAAAVTATVIRGTWADTTVKDPKTPAEGAICRLYQSPDGRKQVRCARVLDHTAAAVWAVVTDYNHFGEIFPYEKDVKGEPATDGRFHVTGLAHAWPYGSWPFDVYVRHEEKGGQYVATWDNPGGALTQNRGSWTVTALEPGKTLLVFSLELEVRPFPTFYVHNVLLNRLKAMPEAVDRRLRTKPATAP